MEHHMITIKPDWWYVGYDDTKDWSFETLPERALPFIEKIITVYACNRTEVTYCCEITPSYWMIAVSFEPIFNTKIWDRPDCEEIREEVFNFVNDVCVQASSCYMHAGRVDVYIGKNKQWTHRIGDPGEDFKEEDLFETWTSNPKF